ncbi:MAG: Tim44 domain-containing protein, partial [Mesorhizobium sp.]|nr:Tim44 domain-containing protein [Mesorhizobium sp.]
EAPQGPENVVSLPRKRPPGEPAADTYAAIDAFAAPDSELNKGLRAIKDNDASFDPKGFVDGAKMAYEMIVMAYADGDRKTLKNLLSREVFDGFVAAIGEREARSEKIQSSFVGIDKADIVNAEMKGGEAHVTLRIVSELISATRDKAGAVIDGDPETVAEVKDVWTFARDTRSRDPNWKLVATEEEE